MELYRPAVFSGEWREVQYIPSYYLEHAELIPCTLNNNNLFLIEPDF